MSKLVGVLLSQVVQRHRDGNCGIGELTSLVEELAASDLTTQEIADKYSTAFNEEETDK